MDELIGSLPKSHTFVYPWTQLGGEDRILKQLSEDVSTLIADGNLAGVLEEDTFIAKIKLWRGKNG